MGGGGCWLPRIGWQQVNDSGSVLVPVGQDVVLLVDWKSFSAVTGSSLRSGIGWCFFLIGAKVAPLFSVCAVLANVSPLTNNTSCEAASIIKKSRLVAHVVWAGFSF